MNSDTNPPEDEKKDEPSDKKDESPANAASEAEAKPDTDPKTAPEPTPAPKRKRRPPGARNRVKAPVQVAPPPEPALAGKESKNGILNDTCGMMSRL